MQPNLDRVASSRRGKLCPDSMAVVHHALLSLFLLEERIRTLSGEIVGGRPTYVSTRSNLFSKIFLSSAHTKELIFPE